MKRIYAFLLAFSILLSLIPVGVQAAEAEITRQSVTAAPDPGLPDNEELFAAYAEQTLYGTVFSPFGISAGSQLSGDLRVLYNALVPIIRDIAEGKRSSTMISIGRTVSYDGVTYKPDVQATFTGNSLSSKDLTRLLTALMSDCPYEMYWYDKTSGCSSDYIYSSTLLYVSLQFSVAGNYSASSYRTDTAKTAAVSAAAANAKRIVSCYDSVTDYNKLMGYADAISDLTSYDFSAASAGNFSRNNDPWQLIHVFDGDPGTRAVCEGYSKAYQYLCDLSDFSGDADCYSVTGTMDGGNHMWNIVTLEGKNYLVDVTNSDGTPFGSDLLMAGCQGTADSRYTISGLTYRYDTVTLGLWGTGSILTLSRTACPPDWATDHTHVYGSWDKFTGASCVRIGIKSRLCEICGYMDTLCSDIEELKAPVLSVSVNTATGKPRLSWESVSGADFYRIYRASGKSGSFTRIKSTSSTSFTDSTAKPGISYRYRLTAVNEDSGKASDRSNIVSRMCDLEKPTVTIGVNTDTGKPVVKWETVKGAEKYYIYRAASRDGTYKHVKTAITARSFTDASAEAGRNYYYKVKAIHEKEGANSAYSAPVNRVCDLAKPEISVRLSNGTPRITWKTVEGAEKYYIYRSTKQGSGYTHVKSAISARSFTDTDVKAGAKYYYKVKAIHSNSAAHSAYSTVRSIAIE